MAVYDYRQSLAHVGMTIITIFGAIVIIVIIISLMVTCCRTLSTRRTHHVRKYCQVFLVKIRIFCVSKTVRIFSVRMYVMISRAVIRGSPKISDSFQNNYSAINNAFVNFINNQNM